MKKKQEASLGYVSKRHEVYVGQNISVKSDRLTGVGLKV